MKNQTQKYENMFIPSTNGEGSLIILGRIPVAEGRSLLCDIKISLGLLHCERSGSLDLGEIYQYHPSECCAFDLRILTFAYSLKEKLPRTPRQAHIELRTPCTLGLSRGFSMGMHAPLRGLRIARSRRDLPMPPLGMLRLRPSDSHVCVFP